MQIIAFAVFGLSWADKKPEAKQAASPAEIEAKDRKIREIKWDHGAWKPIDTPCPTCRQGGPEVKSDNVITSASPRPHRQANNNLVSSGEKLQPGLKPANTLFEVRPQVGGQPLDIVPPGASVRPVLVPNQPQLFVPQQPQQLLTLQQQHPGGRFVFPADGKPQPSHKMHPPLPPPPPPPAQFAQNGFPQRRPVGFNPQSTIHLLPAPLVPQELDPRRPFPPQQRPSADKVIVEVNQIPQGVQNEVTVGKGTGKPRVQLIYIPAAALKGRKDPLASIKGPVTDKLLSELNLPGAKIVSVIKNDPDAAKLANAPPGVKQLSPFNAAGKLNLEFVKSFLPQGAELVSIRGLNGELDVDSTLADQRPSPTPFPRPSQNPGLQALSNAIENSLREGEQNAKALENDRNRPVSPRFQPPQSFRPLKVEPSKVKPEVIEKVVLNDPSPASSDPTISNPLTDDGLALVLNMKAFKVKQDLSLMIHNENKRESMGIEEVIRSLRAVKNFGDPSIDGEYPEVFIAPSSLPAPRNYAKVRLDIPRESERVTSGSPAPPNLPNAYIASRNHLPPEGFVKVNLPKEIRIEIPAGDFETRNPFFKDSSEQKLESGSQFVPRPAFGFAGRLPAVLAPQKPSGPATLQKFWIPPQDQKANELDSEVKPKDVQQPFNPFPAPTTLRPQSSGFRFWPTTARTPVGVGSFGQIFQNQFFGGSSTTEQPTTAGPVTQTTPRFFSPTTFSRPTPAPTPGPTYKYSFPPFAPSTRPPVVPTFTTPRPVSPSVAPPPAPLPYDVPPPEFGAGQNDDLPEAFIGPSDIETPEGYVKIQLPVPGIEKPKENPLDSDDLPEFFIAPADQEPPEGYVRIALPVSGENQDEGNQQQQPEVEAPTTTAAPAPQRAPGRLFSRPVQQQAPAPAQESSSEEPQQPVRRRPAYLRPRRPVYEKKQEAEEQQRSEDVQVVTETAKIDEPSKDNSSTLFPPYQEAIRRFRGKYASDNPAEESGSSTTPAPAVRRVRPVTRRPFAPGAAGGARRKVFVGRRPINRSRNDLAANQDQQENKEEAPATTLQPETAEEGTYLSCLVHGFIPKGSQG